MLSQLVSITYESLNCKIASIHIQPNAWNQICMSATENDPCILEVIVISLNLTFNDKENWETPEENKNVNIIINSRVVFSTWKFGRAWSVDSLTLCF